MKHYKHLLSLLILFLISFGLIACGGDTPTPTPVEPTPTPVEPTPSEPGITVPAGSVLVEFSSTYAVTKDHIIIESGSLLEDLEAPTLSGHIFVDWYQDQELTEFFDFDTPITENTTIYLRYAENTNESMVDLDIEFLGYALEDLKLSGERYTLPTQGRFTSTITWTSSNNGLVTNRGYIIPPATADGEQSVTLSASVRKINVTKVAHYDVTVLPHEPLSEVTSHRDVPFENLTSEYEVLDGTLRAYYLNDLAIPYVDVKDFLLLLDGLIESDELEFVYDEENHTLTISYIYTYTEEDEFGVEEEISETYSAVINFELGTITVETLSFFGGYIKSTATDYSEGLTYLDTYVEDGDSVVFDLNKYRIDILTHEDEGTKFLLPFHLVNTLFIGTSYYNVYYNVDGFFGIYGVPSGSTTASQEAQTAYIRIRNSSVNNTTIPHEIALQTYHMFAFVMDYFFGLKNDMDVETFYNNLEPFANDMVSNNTGRTSNAIFNFLVRGIDELHTGHRFSGFYEAPSHTIQLTYAGLGPRVKDWYNVLWYDVEAALEARFPNNPGNLPPDYRFIDDKTAVIYLDGFYTATVDDPDGDDSNRYMRETLDAIFAENPNVENIAIDLAYNTGGNLGALLRVLGYLTEQPIEMHYQNPTEGSRVSYFVEVETNAYENINWFILTSRVTFSAANLMTSIAKQQGFATIIGTTSGGGASSITPIVLPNGAFYTMSSLNVLSYRTGSDEDGWTYYSIEYGVEPDYIMSPEDLYDDTLLSAKIAEILLGE